jgi:XRE family transcriptional regulator, regulator of sulfur utilization
MSTRGKTKSPPSNNGESGEELGKTIQRLRKAYNLSLGELSEQSGVAKSIISQIERNETNPTLSTVIKLSRALDTTIDEVLRGDTQSQSLNTKPSPAFQCWKAKMVYANLQLLDL